MQTAISSEKAIEQTRKWITDMVVGCNFCPFAARELKRNSIHYEVLLGAGLKITLETLVSECSRLDLDRNIETSFLILPGSFTDFDEYLSLVSLSEKLLKQANYEGIYQVAGFHPAYLFAGTNENDAANYTNRSPYPMLHLLREESIEKALENIADPGNIPERNMRFAREKGLAWMKMMREQCFT